MQHALSPREYTCDDVRDCGKLLRSMHGDLVPSLYFTSKTERPLLGQNWPNLISAEVKLSGNGPAKHPDYIRALISVLLTEKGGGNFFMTAGDLHLILFLLFQV